MGLGRKFNKDLDYLLRHDPNGDISFTRDERGKWIALEGIVTHELNANNIFGAAYKMAEIVRKRRRSVQ